MSNTDLIEHDKERRAVHCSGESPALVTADLLAQECRSKEKSIRWMLQTREVHPTYGVTKASMREAVAHLEGMLFGFGVATGTQPSNSAAIQLIAQQVAKEMGFDMQALARMVEDS